MCVAFANAKATDIFSAKMLVYMPYLRTKVLMILMTSFVLSKLALFVADNVKGLVIYLFCLHILNYIVFGDLMHGFIYPRSLLLS